ncbi:MAG: NAD(P)H-dependent oxidoreductase subunit E, partial [Methylococcales bacterium]|nr:NAD(P)H-dependent oxidoreductase subunit E [Methylococcales bacterium]
MEAFIQGLVKRNNFQSVHLLNILRELQAHYRFISKQAIEILADLLNIERTQIISVVEFYSFFHLQPRGLYDILLSDSITDHMLGKQSLMAYFSGQLNVSIGKVREDGL